MPPLSPVDSMPIITAVVSRNGPEQPWRNSFFNSLKLFQIAYDILIKIIHRQGWFRRNCDEYTGDDFA